MDLRIVKARRVLRKLPRAWLHEMIEPVFNRGQLLTALMSVVVLYLILLHATPEERDVQAFDWAISVQAFAWSLLIWAIISAIRAPLMIVRDDRESGVWRGNKFSYKQPRHVFTREFMGNGLTNIEHVTFEDAEPNSYVEFHIDVQPPLPSRVSIAFSGGMQELAGPDEVRFVQRGVRIDANRQSYLHVKPLKGTTQFVVRVYCDSFTVGRA